jgi:SAM-dependent methyltransferase
MSTSCPACLGDRTRPAFVGRDWALGAAPGDHPYVRCEVCSTVFAHPQPSDETLAAAYPPSYGNYATEVPRLERFFEFVARREAAHLVGRADPGSPLLEIGCGSGRFLERLRAAGWHGALSGIEYSPEVAAATSARLGIHVGTGTAESTPLEPGAYGTIVLRHVLEHLRDPARVLERIRAALAPGGSLYVATPDVQALSALVFGRWWWGWEVPRHLVVFSREGLRNLLGRCDFAVDQEWWYIRPQVWNASLWLALDRGRGRTWARWATRMLNPLVTGPSIAAATAEVVLHRSTMYGVLARPHSSEAPGPS